MLAIKAELRRRMHEPVASVGEWLQKVTLGYYQYYIMLSRAILITLGSSCIGCEGCGEWFYSVAVKEAGHLGIGLTRFWTAGFRYPVSCTLILRRTLTPLIQGGSRTRKRARTVLCGGDQ